MADLAEAFEQHLKSLSDSEWDALVARVRTPEAVKSSRGTPDEPANGPTPSTRPKTRAGLEEALRRGYIGDDGGTAGGKR